MVLQPTGAPKFAYRIDDQSNLPSLPIGGIGCLLVRSARGEHGKAFFISSKNDLANRFGTYTATENDMLYAQLMIEWGAKLWVARAVHYTDASDITTIVGTVATGSNTVGTETVNWEAKSVGEGYNGTIISVVAASSGTANRVDISITVPDGINNDLQEEFDFPASPTQMQIDELNKRLRHVNLVSVDTTNAAPAVGIMPVGDTTLISGAEDRSLVDVNDYAGDENAKTGLHSFDSVKNAPRIANIFPDPLIDNAFETYVVAREDMRAHYGAPLGITVDTYTDYQQRTGIYAGQGSQLDSFFNSAILGGEINVPDPRDLRNTIDIPAIVAAFPRILRKDESGSWWLSASIVPEFGILPKPNNGVTVDMRASGNAAKFDLLSDAGGFNAITNDEDYGATLWGADSAILNRNTLLVNDNICDLILYIIRELPRQLRISQFRPNDPRLWSDTYKRVRPWITDVLVAGRAIRGGENEFWFWIGDQDATSFDNAEFNRLADIDRGAYRIRFVFVPVPATKYIFLDIVPTDSTSVVNAVVRQEAF